MARPALGGREICEHKTVLDIRALHRRGCSFFPGLRFSVDFTGSVIIETEHEALVLEYSVVCAGAMERVPTKQRVPIVWTDCYLGGRRPWFLCGCGRRVAILYAAGSYQCRHCSGLAYRSQGQPLRYRALSKAQKIRMQLGGTPSCMDPFPGRPRRMSANLRSVAR